MEKKSNVKKVYVQIPEPNVYYGIKVSKDTKEEFVNDFVKQKIENLILYTDYTVQSERFVSKIHNELKLQEGELLLLEEENRGFFLPKDVKFGSIDEAVEEIMFIKEEISKIKE